MTLFLLVLEWRVDRMWFVPIFSSFIIISQIIMRIWVWGYQSLNLLLNDSLKLLLKEKFSANFLFLLAHQGHEVVLYSWTGGFSHFFKWRSSFLIPLGFSPNILVNMNFFSQRRAPVLKIVQECYLFKQWFIIFKK